MVARSFSINRLATFTDPPADTLLSVDKRGVVDNKVLLPPRRTGPFYKERFFPRYPEEEVVRICDGRRRRDECRAGIVETGDSLESCNDVREVRAEDAPVGVQLVEDDVLQPVEDLHPFRMVREDPGMQHVGVRNDEPPALSRRLPDRRGGVTVVYVQLEIRDRELLEGFHLVLAQRLGRKKVDRLRVRVFQQAVKHRKVIGKALT
jgi:hypothetical protein